MMERESLIDRLKDQLSKLDDQLTLLDAKAERVSADVKVAYQQQLMDLSEQRQQLRDRIKRAEDNGRELVDTVVEQFETARAALKAGIEELQQQAEE